MASPDLSIQSSSTCFISAQIHLLASLMTRSQILWIVLLLILPITLAIASIPDLLVKFRLLEYFSAFSFFLITPNASSIFQLTLECSLAKSTFFAFWCWPVSWLLLNDVLWSYPVLWSSHQQHRSHRHPNFLSSRVGTSNSLLLWLFPS